MMHACKACCHWLLEKKKMGIQLHWPLHNLIGYTLESESGASQQLAAQC
jgi:hypothetical protein